MEFIASLSKSLLILDRNVALDSTKQERVALQERKETIFLQVVAGLSIM